MVVGTLPEHRFLCSIFPKSAKPAALRSGHNRTTFDPGFIFSNQKSNGSDSYGWIQWVRSNLDKPMAVASSTITAAMVVKKMQNHPSSHPQVQIHGRLTQAWQQVASSSPQPQIASGLSNFNRSSKAASSHLKCTGSKPTGNQNRRAGEQIIPADQPPLHDQQPQLDTQIQAETSIIDLEPPSIVVHPTGAPADLHPTVNSETQQGGNEGATPDQQSSDDDQR
ncbi:hypothetical protein ACLOJK_037052 [Asimina triloba]